MVEKAEKIILILKGLQTVKYIYVNDTVRFLNGTVWPNLHRTDIGCGPERCRDSDVKC